MSLKNTFQFFLITFTCAHLNLTTSSETTTLTSIFQSINQFENQTKNDIKLIELIKPKNCSIKNYIVFITSKVFTSTLFLNFYQLFLLNHQTFIVSVISERSPLYNNNFESGNFHKNNVEKISISTDSRGDQQEMIFYYKKVDRKVKADPTVYVSNYNQDSKLLFFIDNLNDIFILKRELVSDPNLIKIVYALNDCNTNELETEFFLFQLFKQLWEENRVSYIYYIGRCVEEWEGSIPITYSYSPFHQITIKNKTIWGKLIKQVGLIFNEIDVIHTNFENIKLNLDIFPAVHVFRKSKTTILKDNNEHYNSIEEELTDINAYIGLDVCLAKELMRVLNFTANLSLPSDGIYFGYKLPSGDFNGAIGDVIHKRADWLINSFFIKDYETRAIEFTSAYFNDKVCVFVQKAGLVPDSLNLFRCFHPIVWICTASVITIVSIFYTAMMKVGESILVKEKVLECKKLQQNFNYRNRRLKRIHEKLSIHQKIVNIVRLPFEIISALVSAPTGNIGDSHHRRIFIAFGFLFSLIIIGAFQGSLVDIFTSSLSYPDINTLAQLDKSGLSIALRYKDLVVDVFGNEKPGTVLGNLRQRIKTEGLSDNIPKQVVDHGDISALITDFDFVALSLSFIRKDGVSLLHLIKECPKHYTQALIFPKSSVFYETINQYLNLLQQNGFMAKCYNDGKFILQLEAALVNRNYIRSKKVKLTLSILQMAFIILGIGLTFSLSVFIIELRLC